MRPLILLAALLCAGCPAEPAPAARPKPRPSPAIVTASPGLAEMVCALGAEAHLVGVSQWCKHPPSLQTLPRIGGMVDPNLEAIDALAPDLILLGGTRSQPVRDLAQRRGYRVEELTVDTIDGVSAALTRLGELLGRKDAAAREVTRLKAALAEHAARAPKTPPRTLLVFGHKPGRLGQVSSPGRGTFLSECLVAAGGRSCLDGLPPKGYHLISQEVLLQTAPEVIVELSAEPLDAATRAALRRDWAPLEAIPAVARGKIAIVSGPEMMIPGPRLDAVVGKLARALRGELDVE